ncbi:protein E1 [Elephant endotheliotropic herpesvirus 5B]|nr:protein E1 [Elephant endotheliotropic herpesvirus 5B]
MAGSVLTLLLYPTGTSVKVLLIAIICVSGTTISPGSYYSTRTSAIFLEDLEASTEDVSSSGSGEDETSTSYTSATSETPTFTNTNFASAPATTCSCPPVFNPNETYTYINVTNTTSRQKTHFTCTFTVEWTPSKDSDDNSTETTSATPSPSSAAAGRADATRDSEDGAFYSPARKSLQLTVTILCLVILFTCVFSPLPFRSSLYLVFPKNSGLTQLVLVIGVLFLFIIAIMACLRDGELPLYADHVSFMICYSALLVNAFNLFLSNKFCVLLPEKLLAACAVFCTLVGAVNTLTCYQVSRYIAELHAKVSGLEVVQYEFVDRELKKINFIETSILDNLHLIGYICPQLFLVCAAIFSTLLYRTSKYAKILCFTCIALIITHTIHLRVLRLPESRLCIACGYVFLLAYVIPITVCAFKPLKLSFFKSGDDTKKLLVHEEKNV